MAWTAPITYTTGMLMTAAIGNAHWRDNMLLLATSIETATGRISGELKNFRQERTHNATATGAITADLSLSNAFSYIVTGNVSGLTVSNWTASKGQPVTLRITQNGTGGWTFAFPAGWKWSGGSVPVLSTGANKTDIVVLWSDDGGTTIFASLFVVNG